MAIDTKDLYDPVTEIIAKQLGSIWKPELFQRSRSRQTWKHMHVDETPSTPYSYEDELIHAIDLKYGGGFKEVLTYQYLYMGFSIADIARKIGKHRNTVAEWVKEIRKNKELQEALRKIVRGE